MIVSYTDRVVRVYGWYGNITGSDSNPNSINPNLANSSSSKMSNNSTYSYSFQENGRILLDQSWEFPDLVSKITFISN